MKKHIELYELHISVLTAIYLTALRSPYTSSENVTYDPAVVTRQQIEEKSEIEKSEVEVSFRYRDTIYLERLRNIGFVTVTLKIREVNTETGEIINLFSGRVINLKFKSHHLILRAESRITATKQSAPVRRYQRSCPYLLYGQGCQAKKARFAVPSSILEAVESDQLRMDTIGGFETNYFRGGMCLYGGQKYFILRPEAPDLITLSRAVKIGRILNVTLYPGCSHTLDECDTKFDNALNYGGFPDLPIENPFNQISLV